jgi:hypothetical protein
MYLGPMLLLRLWAPSIIYHNTCPHPIIIITTTTTITIISCSTVLVRTLAASHWRFCNLF